jgi:hypothetical protein
MHSFGPGRDEVTTPVFPGINGQRPRMAQVWGFDGVLRDEIVLSGVLKGRGIADLECSPDGSWLAASTFPGRVEPDCPGQSNWDSVRAVVPNEGAVYLFHRAGGDPELVYRHRAQPALDLPPVLTDLAWSPDGKRLGLVSSTYCHHGQPESPALLALDVESGQAQALYQFDETYDDYTSATEGFAWSPDGTRIARPTPNRDPRQRSRTPGLACPVGRLRIRRTSARLSPPHPVDRTTDGPRMPAKASSRVHSSLDAGGNQFSNLPDPPVGAVSAHRLGG